MYIVDKSGQLVYMGGIDNIPGKDVDDIPRAKNYVRAALDEMKAAVDRGDYDIAVALHPVSLDDLMAVADAGLEDPEIVMPEKSTFFQPKILSGLSLYRYAKK